MWREVTVWEWVCDRCQREAQATDDRQPEGWQHTMAGNDLCADCLRTAPAVW